MTDKRKDEMPEEIWLDSIDKTDDCVYTAAFRPECVKYIRAALLQTGWQGMDEDIVYIKYAINQAIGNYKSGGMTETDVSRLSDALALLPPPPTDIDSGEGE
jgi:hypothetical protein